MGCSVNEAAPSAVALNDPLTELTENSGFAADAAWPACWFSAQKADRRNDTRRTLFGPGNILRHDRIRFRCASAHRRRPCRPARLRRSRRAVFSPIAPMTRLPVAASPRRSAPFRNPNTAPPARASSRKGRRCRRAAAVSWSERAIPSPASATRPMRSQSATPPIGTASWYGEAFHGRRTANGEVYDRDGISAAHPTMPLPAYARVTNMLNNRSIIVRVNDRGPYHGGRVMDVSQQHGRCARLPPSRHRPDQARISRPGLARRL